MVQKQRLHNIAASRGWGGDRGVEDCYQRCVLRSSGISAVTLIPHLLVAVCILDGFAVHANRSAEAVFDEYFLLLENEGMNHPATKFSIFLSYHHGISTPEGSGLPEQIHVLLSFLYRT